MIFQLVWKYAFCMEASGLRNMRAKGQLISKANCQVVNSSKKRMNEFVSTTMPRVLIRFLEEIEDT